MKLNLIPREQFTVGTWIDCDCALRNNDRILVASLQYQPFTLLTNVNWNVVMGAFEYFMKWRQDLMKAYSNQFGEKDEHEVDEDELYNRYHLRHTAYEVQWKKDKDWFDQTFNWYSVLYHDFANKDYLKMDACLRLPVISVLNHLEYLRQKDIFYPPRYY